MVESSDEPSLLDRIRSKAHVTKTNLFGPTEPPDVSAFPARPNPNDADLPIGPPTKRASTASKHGSLKSKHANVASGTSSTLPISAPPPQDTSGHGEEPSTLEESKEPNMAKRFYNVSIEVLLSSPVNILLVFVPVGIAVNFTGINPVIIFAMNAIAIIPLAGLLSHATESVASTMGDTVGALMNVTFGNAVELIIFMYVSTHEKTKTKEELGVAYMLHTQLDCVPRHLTHSLYPPAPPAGEHDHMLTNEIRIVQASLLGSILANLLLILGMCFLLGGLRFREQIYNSTVTQMSACLLSLSVTSLLLPTAFHASFTDNSLADAAVLQVSRGTSIILLLVYILYLVFQLKSHAYMYESTPQHIIDEESHPGVLAEIFSSSSSSDGSDSSDSDSDASSDSRTTAKRIRRAFRGRRRRKSSASSKDTPSTPSVIRTPSNGTFPDVHSSKDTSRRQMLGAIASGDEADTDGEGGQNLERTRQASVISRGFEKENLATGSKSPDAKQKRKQKKKSRKHKHRQEKQAVLDEKAEDDIQEAHISSVPQRVTFQAEPEIQTDNNIRRPFNLRGISVRPNLPKMLTSTVFSAQNPTGLPNRFAPPMGTVPRTQSSLRRTNSLPDRLNRTLPTYRSSEAPSHKMPMNASSISVHSDHSVEQKHYISRRSAVVLLLISTGLVAICAEFLVASINYLVDNTSVSEAFIGLIILPIVGNAAEHVTAVTVASKNKMDLAIGVAVGSSIQIALFVTPVIVLLGWCLGKDMSLYFTLFETVSLFVSAFIINFLVLDGRSNYLEGALLIAGYVIIAIGAFFYPDSAQQSVLGGAEPSQKFKLF
ncbi:hypothetical protein MMC25_003304 [Agyrium rufum]|nr:hypothetical protein [Agyrium rufum]